MWRAGRWLDSALNTAAAWFDRAVSPGRCWALRIGLIAVALAVLHGAPPYDLVLDSDYGSTGNAQKGRHPLTHLTGEGRGDPASHDAKLDFRFVVPLLLRPFNGSRAVGAALFAASGVLAIALLASELRRRGVEPRTVALGLFGVALTAAGGVFVQTVDYFDAVAIALVVTAGFVRRRLVAGAAAFAALYTDERALIGLALVIGAAAWLDRSTVLVRRGLTLRTMAVASAMYLVTRVALDVTTDLRTERAGVGLRVAIDNLDRWPIALAAAFGVWWLIVAAGLYSVRADRTGWIVIGLTAGAVVSALTVDDVTRSLAYSLPVVPVVLVALSRTLTPRRLDRVLGSALGACALTPIIGMAGELGRFNPLLFQIPRWVT